MKTTLNKKKVRPQNTTGVYPCLKGHGGKDNPGMVVLFNKINEGTLVHIREGYGDYKIDGTPRYWNEAAFFFLPNDFRVEMRNDL
jgi:hypothetical protein